MQPSQPFTVHLHSGQTPSVPRSTDQSLCEISMTITILIFPHNFESNRAFFLLHSRVPIFPAHDYLGQDSPQRGQGAIIDLFLKQGINVFTSPGDFSQELHSNEFSDTLPFSARLQVFFGYFSFPLSKFFTRFLQVLQV